MYNSDGSNEAININYIEIKLKMYNKLLQKHWSFNNWTAVEVKIKFLIPHTWHSDNLNQKSS